MIYAIYIAAAAVVGVLIGFVVLSVTWLKKTVAKNIRSKTTELISVYDDLLEEKSRLFAAIRKAKDALDMDMDSEVSLNAARQSIARTFKRMNDLRSSEQLLSGGGTGYRFNAEGNQISYCCDVKRVTTINYDRKVIHSALSRLNRQADETSNRLDLCLVTSKVDYTVPFDVNASFAEAFEIYLENAKTK